MLGRKFICNRNIGGGSEALFQCYGLIPHASSSIFLHHKFHTIYLVLLFDCSKEDVLLPSWYLLKLSLFSKNDNGWYQKIVFSDIMVRHNIAFLISNVCIYNKGMYEQSCKLFHLPRLSSVDKSSTILLQILEDKKIHGKTNWYPF